MIKKQINNNNGCVVQKGVQWAQEKINRKRTAGKGTYRIGQSGAMLRELVACALEMLTVMLITNSSYHE